MKRYISRKHYDTIQEVTGKNRKTIINSAHVAGRTRATREILPTAGTLGFSHYAEVACLSTERQIEILTIAIKEKWSVRKLRKEVREYQQFLKRYNELVG